MENITVDLDSLDGFAFEEICAEIYRRKGYSVENVKSTGDEGRDLILRGPDGETIVAECKHWPNGTVGRPVIQKLHSAASSFPARDGIVLTTGSFSRQAFEYIERPTVDVSIRLIDGRILKGIASEVGIDLTSGADPRPILSFAITDYSGLLPGLNEHVYSKLDSHPKTPAQLFQPESHAVTRRPVFLLGYSLTQEFSTSVGVLHTIQIPNAEIMISGQDGINLSQEWSEFLSGARLNPASERPEDIEINQIGEFRLDSGYMHEIAKERITELHTTRVTYTGRNNQTYVRDCVPSKRNILLKNIQQVFLVEYHLQLNAFHHEYRFDFLENQNHFLWLQPPDIFECKECDKRARECLLCNVCGATTHLPRFVHPHSFRCKSCFKTICKDCAYWVPRLAVFKKILCLECVEVISPLKTRKIRV